MTVGGSELFTARSDRRDGIARLVLEGDLDLSTCSMLEEHLALLRHEGVSAIIVDLQGLTFMDSSGLRILLGASKAAKEGGYQFAVVGVGETARRLFEVTGTDWLLNEDEGRGLLDQFARGVPTV
jgi:anti-sigma B factor antagonist